MYLRQLEELTLRLTWSSTTHRDWSQLLRLKYSERLSINCLSVYIGAFLLRVKKIDSLNALKLSNISIAALGVINRLTVLILQCDCGQAANTTSNSYFDVVLVLCGK